MAIRTFTFTLINHANKANTLDPIALTYARIQRTGAHSNALLKKNIALSPFSVQSSSSSSTFLSFSYAHSFCLRESTTGIARAPLDWIEPYYTRPMTMTSLAILWFSTVQFCLTIYQQNFVTFIVLTKTSFLLTYASYNLSNDCLNAFDADFYTPSQITFPDFQFEGSSSVRLRISEVLRDSIGAGHHGVKLLVVNLCIV